MQSPRRALIIVVLMGVFAGALVLRVAHIQWLARSHYLAMATRKPGTTHALQGARGRILDRRLRVLAESITTTDISISPWAVQKWAVRDTKQSPGKMSAEDFARNPAVQGVARAIAEELELPEGEVLAKIIRRPAASSAGGGDEKSAEPGAEGKPEEPKGINYAPLAKSVKTERVERLKARKVLVPRKTRDRSVRGGYRLEDTETSIPGLSYAPREVRNYPLKRLAAGAIGYINALGQPAGGLELSCRQATAPQVVNAGAQFDSFGRRIVSSGIGGRPRPAPGRDVVLTLDLGTQQVVERELDKCVDERHPVGVNVVVMSARDGAVLAIGCRPTYNPNDISNPGSERKPVSKEALRNRPVSWPMEPGSTLKFVTVAAAIDAGIINESTHMFCRGTIPNVGGAPLSCWGKYKHQGHGSLTPAGILSGSCNLCAAELARLLGRQRLYDFFSRCGIGQRPGAGFPGEDAGQLIKPDEMGKRDLACIGFGQRVLVTDLQLAAAVSAIMNGGVMYRPHVVAGYVNLLDGERSYYPVEPEPLQRVCSERTSSIMRKLAQEVVDKGTGKPARIPGVAIGGKTATAQIFDRARMRWLDGPQDYLMGFTLVGPTDRECDFVITVTVQQPKVGQHGSEVAGPIAREVARHLLTQPGLFPPLPRSGKATQAVGGPHLDATG